VPETERLAVKHLLIELAAEHPRLRQSLLASLANVAPESLMDLGLQRRALKENEGREEGLREEGLREEGLRVEGLRVEGGWEETAEALKGERPAGRSRGGGAK
jgi:hypothetical protein